MSSSPSSPSSPPSTSPNRLVLIAAGLVVAVIVGGLLELTRSVALPFAVATLLAVPLGRAASMLEERLHLSEALATALALLGGLLISGAGAFVLLFALSPLYEQGPEYLREVGTALDGAVARIPWERLGVSAPSLPSLMSEGSAQRMASPVMGLAAELFSALSLGALFLLFLVVSRRSLRRKLSDLVCAVGLQATSTDDLVSELGEDISRYIWLKTVISVLTGAAFGLACWLAGLPFPLLWGVLACALNYIPSIGPILASIPGVALCFSQFESVLVALAVAGVLLGIQMLSGAVIEPRVLGDRLDLNIITVLLSLSLWGLIWGPVGMLLAVPLTVAIRLVLARGEQTEFIADLLAS